MARNDSPRIEKWIRRMFNDPMVTRDGERKCVALALMHVTGGARTEVQSLKLGAKTWDPKQLAEMFDSLATEHAAGLASGESGSGQEAFQVVAFFDDLPDLPVSPLPLMKSTGSPVLEGEAIVTEPPTPRGELGQNMRERSGWMQFTLEMNARMYTTMTGIIDRLSSRLGVVERENIDAFQIAKDTILEKAADVHAHRMKELEFERSSEERARIMKALPPLVNKVLGKEVFPQSMVDTSLLEGLLESADEEQIQRIFNAVMPVLKPEQAAFLMSRFADIQENLNARKQAATKQAAHANGNGVVKA